MSMPAETLEAGSRRAWLGGVRRFARCNIAPRVNEMDRSARLDPELRDELFTSGIMALQAPAAYGGRDLPFLDAVCTIEEIARVCSGVAVVVVVHNMLVSSMIRRHGSGDQRRRYLPPLSQAMLGAFAISEEQAGSDAFALATVAEPDGSGFRLTGRKRWTSGANAADLFIVFARASKATGGRLTAFVVERESSGLSIEDPFEQIGVRAAASADLVLEEVPVRREQILAGPGRGEIVALDAFALGRVSIAAQLVGLAQAALDAAVEHASIREQFGRPIAAFQGVRLPLAAVSADIEAARLLTRHCARAVERDEPQGQQLRLAAMAKYTASITATRASSRAMETLGGRGVVRGAPVEKLFRDARAGAVYEGMPNILLRAIAADLFHATRAVDDD
jgi:short-chain 2-methylacyl-CoA dehydrogenase